MALFETSLALNTSLSEVFDFFVRPALLIGTAPPELSLRLVEAPERLHLAARVVIKTAFEPGKLLAERQIEGTFRKWEMTHEFDEEGAGTRVRTRIDFEPPGGLLGLTVTEAVVRRELEWVFAYRAERLRERFGAKESKPSAHSSGSLESGGPNQ